MFQLAGCPLAFNSGPLMQWGKWHSEKNHSATVTFPCAFQTTNYSLAGTSTTSSSLASVFIGNTNNSKVITAISVGANNTDVARSGTWICVGY